MVLSPVALDFLGRRRTAPALCVNAPLAVMPVR